MAPDEIADNGVIIRPTGRAKAGRDYDSGILVYDCKPPARLFCARCLNCYTVWLVKDGLGISCATITWLLLGYAQFVVLFVILIPSTNQIHSFINGVIFEALLFLAISSHLKAMMSDPGAVTRGNATAENIARMGLREGQVIYKCVKCNSIKPERAHHCSTCERCVRKMDHHCPWVNNCVGEDNQKYFVLFTMYICIASWQALYLCAFHFVTCASKDWSDCRTFSQAASTILMMFLLMEGLLFGVFTGIMCISQIVSIASDETGIETLKHDRVKREQDSCWYNLKVMFGHPFSYRWFSPFHTAQLRKLPASLYEV